MPCAAGEKLTVQLRAHLLYVEDIPMLEGQLGKRLELQLSCAVFFSAKPVYILNNSPRKVAVKGLLSWLRNSGACHASIECVGLCASSFSPSFLTGTLTINMKCMDGNRNAFFTSCDDLASVINDVKEMSPAPSQPVFKCTVVQRNTGVASLEFVRLP